MGVRALTQWVYRSAASAGTVRPWICLTWTLPPITISSTRTIVGLSSRCSIESSYLPAAAQSPAAAAQLGVGVGAGAERGYALGEARDVKVPWRVLELAAQVRHVDRRRRRERVVGAREGRLPQIAGRRRRLDPLPLQALQPLPRHRVLK